MQVRGTFHIDIPGVWRAPVAPELDRLQSHDENRECLEWNKVNICGGECLGTMDAESEKRGILRRE